MGTTYESAKGIVFIASDNATFMAGSAVARRQRLQELGFGALISSHADQSPRPRITICRSWIGATSGPGSAGYQREQRAHHLKRRPSR
jgi:hypothetical protein